jgi:hypothetical protein
MNLALISSDFLISPAYCDKENVEQRIEDLMQVNALLRHMDSFFIEDDALTSLVERGMYPAEGVFKNNLKACGIEGYSAKDIAKVVNSVLVNAPSIAEVVPERVSEWQGKMVSVLLENVTPSRQAELRQLLGEISLHGTLTGTEIAFLHYCKHNKIDHAILTGTLKDVYPDECDKLPLDVNFKTLVYKDIRAYLSTVDALELFERAEEPEQVKLAIYIKALNIISTKGGDIDSVDFCDFDLGGKFVESLRINQCWKSQGFASVTLQRAGEVIADRLSGQYNIFATKKGGSAAREQGDYKAYREHVTKTGVALRLMFWRNKTGQILLSNVGPKQELLIYPVDS